ncbi:hypothetical protein Spa11_13640 [Botrimarina mediterranea]|uniref:Uncharacterized protein n=2 Tax=Botrimarina mediterranea TaxID=2528022 RepID=A0A518K5U8_9BACT|nr:hypothetical protein Spa11_13640 [Botrimarina mediterranea]
MAFRPGGSGRAHRERRTLGLMALVLSVCLLPAPLRAQDGGGSESSDARQAALRAIPWQSLTAADRPEVQRIVTDATLYRQMPTRVIDCDDELFAYLVDHPELIVDSWNVMGVSRLRLEPIAPGRYRVADTAGAAGDIRVLHREGGGAAPLRMLLLAEGSYQAPPMPSSIDGQSVILLRAEPIEERNGRCYLTTRLDTFIRFEGPATKLVAKTLKPLILRTADHNFVETMRFVALFSRTAETNPDGMVRLAGRLEQVDAATRDEFAARVRVTADRYAERRRLRENVALEQPATWVR